MEEEGTSKEDAIAKIWMVDSRGLLTKVIYLHSKLYYSVQILIPVFVGKGLNSRHIVLFPIQGRKAGGITEHKAVYAKDHPDIKSLEDVCDTIKPTVAIGKTHFMCQAYGPQRLFKISQ